MRFVLAPDSFKESMTAAEAAHAMELGVHDVLPDATCVRAPVADGGEGTARVLTAALRGSLVSTPAHDALGRPVCAEYGYVAEQRLAIIEVAAAAGIALVTPADRDPLLATSRGVGEVILDALGRGARRFVVGLGGSVTNDAGAGMLQALGVRLLDVHGQELGPGGGALADLDRIDASGLDPRLSGTVVEIASDVTNPLCGPDGASVVFGPQKGAAPSTVASLDDALSTFARHLAATTGRDVADIPGAGAAGGLGAALLAFFDSRVRSGIDVVLDATGFDALLRGADLILTGEGSVDAQTLHGKSPYGVARAGQRAGVPTVVFAGAVGEGAEQLFEHGVQALVPIVRSVCDLPTALAHGPANLRQATAMVCRLLAAGPR